MVRPLGKRLALAASQAGAPSVVGSSGSGPHISPMTRPQSAAVRASGPTVSRVNDSGMALARLTRPEVGLRPVMPQKCAGRRIEPPVSEPSAAGMSRAATAAPEPEEEPPVFRVTSHGLCAGPRWALGPVAHDAQLGPAHNPWDVARITGGSSSGSGAAV